MHMRNNRSARSGRAFSLVEMLFAMTILGIVLGLTVAEFTAAIQNFRFEDAHLDAETQGRIAMAKINDLMKMATPDIADQGLASPNGKCQTVGTCPVLAASLPNSVDGATQVSFFVVTNDVTKVGHLSQTTMTTNGNGEPIPVYDVVTVLYDGANTVESCRVPATTFDPANPCANVTPQIITHNVDPAPPNGAAPFGVTPLGCSASPCQDQASAVQIDLSIVNQAAQVAGTGGSSTSGGVAERAQVSNTLFFPSWKAFH